MKAWMHGFFQRLHLYTVFLWCKQGRDRRTGEAGTYYQHLTRGFLFKHVHTFIFCVHFKSRLWELLGFVDLDTGQQLCLARVERKPAFAFVEVFNDPAVGAEIEWNG